MGLTAGAVVPVPAGPPAFGSPGAPFPDRPALLIALDLDGTVLGRGPDGTPMLDARNRDAIHAAVDAGHHIVIATGRTCRSALPWVSELRIVAPMITYGGAVIRRPPHHGSPDGEDPLGAVLFSASLGARHAARVVAIARKHDWQVLLEVDDDVYSEPRATGPLVKITAGQVQITFVESVDDLLNDAVHRVVCVVQDPVAAAQCERLLRAEFAGSAAVTRSLPTYIEVTSATATKGQALTRLCAMLGVAMPDVIAVGDEGNDIDLLTTAGFGIAVAGSPPELLAVADATCRPPDEGGIAAVLARLNMRRA